MLRVAVSNDDTVYTLDHLNHCAVLARTKFSDPCQLRVDGSGRLWVFCKDHVVVLNQWTLNLELAWRSRQVWGRLRGPRGRFEPYALNFEPWTLNFEFWFLRWWKPGAVLWVVCEDHVVVLNLELGTFSSRLWVVCKDHVVVCNLTRRTLNFEPWIFFDIRSTG